MCECCADLFVSIGGVGIKPRALCMLCVCFIAELQPNPLMKVFLRGSLFISIREIQWVTIGDIYPY